MSTPLNDDTETLRFRGPTVEAALDAAEKSIGGRVRLISANRLRRGGIGGFFAADMGVEIAVAPEHETIEEALQRLVDGTSADEREEWRRQVAASTAIAELAAMFGEMPEPAAPMTMRLAAQQPPFADLAAPSTSTAVSQSTAATGGQTMPMSFAESAERMDRAALVERILAERTRAERNELPVVVEQPEFLDATPVTPVAPAAAVAPVASAFASSLGEPTQLDRALIIAQPSCQHSTTSRPNAGFTPHGQPRPSCGPDAALPATSASASVEDELDRAELLIAERARLERARLELAQAEQARVEQTHLDVSRAEQARFELAHAERARIEQARLDAAHDEFARAEQARAEQARAEFLRAEQARAELAHAEFVKVEQARVEQARAEQARLEFLRAEQARAEQVQADQMRMEQMLAEQARIEQERVDLARAEQARLEQARLDEVRAEQERLEQARVSHSQFLQTQFDEAQFDAARFGTAPAQLAATGATTGGREPLAQIEIVTAIDDELDDFDDELDDLADGSGGGSKVLLRRHVELAVSAADQLVESLTQTRNVKSISTRVIVRSENHYEVETEAHWESFGDVR
jgi:uncharacterized protein YjbI with pentapeptide repeats